MKIGKGQYVLLEAGEYSDRRTLGLFRCIKDFESEQFGPDWIEKHSDQADDYHFDEDAFVFWLASEKVGILEEIEFFPLHVASYSCLGSTHSDFMPDNYRKAAKQ